ncbi:Hypothetical predicted protein [Mytilus galloprovincialis]|uniref:Uncharacterized protein n=1 Tax=Mytilus galloprovincialis TaxID=29158 RepID=A0A8B6C954_MYTGA|nr:Hypothetical predicted protein [Mytilus galloprovincialis]
MKTRISFLVIILIFITTYDVTEATCAGNEFTCDNGACIQSVYRCDDSFECDDRSDELNCPSEQPCVEGLQKCSSGECLADLNNCPSETSSIQTSTAASQKQPTDDLSPTLIAVIVVVIVGVLVIIAVLVLVLHKKCSRNSVVPDNKD